MTHAFIIAFCLILTLRGLLTGKFKRGDSLGDPNSSRIAWVEAEQSRTNQSHPSLSNYADKEEFWRLLETMDKIAAAHGQFTEYHWNSAWGESHGIPLFLVQ